MGSVLLTVAATFWGGLFPVAQSVLVAVDGFYLTLFRYPITAAVFTAILVVTESRAALRAEGRLLELAAFGTLGYAGFSLFVFAGLPHTTSEHASVITPLMPLLTALLLWVVRGQRPRPATFAAIALALVGVALVVTKGDLAHLLASGGGVGDGMVLAGVACWVIYTLGAMRFPGWSPLRYATMTCIPGAAMIVVFTVVADRLGHASAPELATLVRLWPELAFTLICSSIVAVFAWNAGIKALGPTNGVLFINLVPVTAFAIGVAQGHTFTWAELVGSALTLLAVAVNSLWTGAPRARPAAARAARTAACPQEG